MIEATSTLLRFYNDKHVLSLLTVMVRPPRYRRIQKELPEREVITEPARRSIYDVLQTNLKIAKRVCYIHRLMYIGEHNFSVGDVVEVMEKNYKQTNSGYGTEPLSGILLHYSKYFCCIVEGSEEAIAKHLHLLFHTHEKDLNNVKLLSPIHHVKARFLNEWMSYYGRPPERVEDIDAESNLENSMRYVTECCEKLYRFANAFISDQMKLRAAKEEEEKDDEIPLPGSKPRSRSLVERDIYSVHLPEIKLLDFLTSCKYLKTLSQYYKYYEYIGQSQDYRFKTWPAPKNFVPYDIFDETYDPITDLPVAAGQAPVIHKEDDTSQSETESINARTET
ncbi:hypothetical protein Zmor_008558 [Zophobas morio]|uniref:BLUF domain-containing protein n=2 Tax=Zophobas morio TaxID=2755281 RepID=A0AA38IVL8_9CUCU|nr:hypothetical protein Zmor_008558 [Zophobas morio]